MKSTARIFVYGTLRRLDGNPMHSLLGEARFLGVATCMGELYSAGSYPGLTRSDGGDGRVIGEVYELKDPESVLEALDEYEGCDPSNADRSLFVRELAPVQLENGDVLEVWVYYFNRPVGGLDRIHGGDYSRWVGRG